MLRPIFLVMTALSSMSISLLSLVLVIVLVPNSELTPMIIMRGLSAYQLLPAAPRENHLGQNERSSRLVILLQLVLTLVAC